MARRSDSATMAKAAKVAQWRACLARFQKSGLTVARFCEKEGVSTPSFYQWRRKLVGIDAPRRQSDATQASAPDKPKNGAAFRALQILPAAAAATIRLPNGIEIELGGDLRAFDLLARRLLDGSLSEKDGQPC